jgi:hypothetical protein
MQPSSQAIRKQLKRVLAHTLFTNSKRYPVLLAYIVEQTLLGNGSQLKERTTGIEAFGREPDYDVNADPVVRTTSAEVRKRLIQYYYDQAHAGELVIELQAGPTSQRSMSRQQPPKRLPERPKSAMFPLRLSAIQARMECYRMNGNELAHEHASSSPPHSSSPSLLVLLWGVCTQRNNRPSLIGFGSH